MNNEEARNFISMMSEGYKNRKLNNKLYSNDDFIPQRIIEIYYKCVEKPKFSIIVNEYKKKYIYNEARVETNISREEQLGLGIVYDYIESFDFDKSKFNIFVSSMLIHQKLYSKCPGSSFGGSLRDDQAIMKGTYIDVMPASESKKYFNEFISNSDFIFEPLENNDIFGYIDRCIITITDLIKAQPFADGNKRTFRSLLSLMLKKINIPPIYIEESERSEYKKCLLKAMIEGDYQPIIRFYYYKICDAIVELDLHNSQIKEECNEVYSQRVR